MHSFLLCGSSKFCVIKFTFSKYSSFSLNFHALIILLVEDINNTLYPSTNNVFTI